MTGSKLILLLKSVLPEEMHWLAKWVRSPFYNSNSEVINLFDYLRKYAPEFDSTKLVREKVFAHLFPDKPYDDQRLRLLMFRLADLVEEFLVAQRLKRDRMNFGQILQAELGERNQYELFVRENHKQVKNLDKNSYRDESYYLAKWHLQHDHFFHLQTRRYKTSVDTLRDMMQNLDAFYILSKMRYSTELRNRQNILSEEHEILLLDEIQKLVTAHQNFASDRVFQVYSDMLRLMENPDNEDIYLRLEGNFTESLALFSPAYQSSMIRYLINITIQLYNNGKEEYLLKQFNLYQLGLEKELLLDEDYLPDSTFLNIIVSASVLKKLEWVKLFMARYGPKLSEEVQTDAVCLGTAYLYFAEANFKGSNELLREIKTPDLQYQLRMKSLSLRNHFEIFLTDDSYYELVDYEAKAFEKFLRRDERLSDTRIRSYLQFISLLQKLAYMKTSFQWTTENKNKLKKRLQGKKQIIAKQWFLEKIAAMDGATFNTD